jgi:hypothetical protein
MSNNRVIMSSRELISSLFDNIRDNVKIEITGFYVSLSAATGTQAGCITLTGLPYFRCHIGVYGYG